MGILHTAPPGAGETASLYRWLTDRQGRCNVFDGHLFACILARRWPIGAGALGLSDVAVTRLLERYFPGALRDGLPVLEASSAPLSAHRRGEVRELADLLLAHRSQGTDTEVWLAAVIARAALDGGPLWQDLGLNGPRHLAAVVERHFHPLAVLNTSGSRWKTFLYRLLCARDGLIPCGAPACRDCGAEAVCFGAGE